MDHFERSYDTPRKKLSPGSSSSCGRKRSRVPKSLSVKRIAVRNAHERVSELLKKFSVPRVKKVFGFGILRVCCRTVEQLKHINTILKTLLTFGLIQEVGMPLEYTYKMKTLVLFMKPTDVESANKLQVVFQKCSFGYSHLMIDVEYPNGLTNQVPKKSMNTIPVGPAMKHAYEPKPNTQSDVKAQTKGTNQQGSKPTTIRSKNAQEAPSTMVIQHAKHTQQNAKGLKYNDKWLITIFIFAMLTTLCFSIFY